MSGKKVKKADKIKVFIERKKTTNAKYCDQNDCAASPYMEGVNKFADELLQYINTL